MASWAGEEVAPGNPVAAREWSILVRALACGPGECPPGCSVAGRMRVKHLVLALAYGPGECPPGCSVAGRMRVGSDGVQSGEPAARMARL